MMCEYTNLQCELLKTGGGVRGGGRRGRGRCVKWEARGTRFGKFRYCSLPLASNETDGQRPPQLTMEHRQWCNVGAWNWKMLFGDGIC